MMLGVSRVYSTGVGRICPKCGWPANDCKCSSNISEEAVPAKIVAKLRIEMKGRGGKTVTVVYDLPRNSAFWNRFRYARKEPFVPRSRQSSLAVSWMLKYTTATTVGMVR